MAEENAINKIGKPEFLQVSGTAQLQCMVSSVKGENFRVQSWYTFLRNLFLAIFFVRILAPTTFMFFTSALPAIAFGEQLSKETGFWLLCLSLAK